MVQNLKIAIIALAVIILAGAVYGASLWFGQKQLTNINSFETCAAAGNPIMESYPEQCRTSDGRTFTRQLNDEEKNRIEPPGRSSKMGILQGKALISPGCPVERLDQPCRVAAEDYTSRELIVYKTDGITQVARQHFSQDGAYKFYLAPGVYIINIRVQDIGDSKDLPQTVIIKAGETVNLNFSIDIGIR